MIDGISETGKFTFMIDGMPARNWEVYVYDRWDAMNWEVNVYETEGYDRYKVVHSWAFVFILVMVCPDMNGFENK